MPCACMAVTTAAVFCHKTLSLQLLWSPKTRLGQHIFPKSGVVEKKGMCVPSSPHPTLVPNAIASGTRGAHTVVDALFAWVPLILPLEVVSLATHVFGFTTILPMESLLQPSLLHMTMAATRHWWYELSPAPKSSARFAQRHTLLCPPALTPRVLGVSRSPLLKGWWVSF